ncbi:MAG: polynucleotide adenylyltransferase PcnB, partial [Proteobacteria bacterium]|nr:polynucleotide adenylyltransferase PcnB [Pseudomonadota bacterium]
MIRKLLRRVFRRAAPANRVLEPAVIPVSRHGVRREQISPAANKVCATLQEAGHKAYVVGG